MCVDQIFKICDSASKYKTVLPCFIKEDTALCVYKLCVYASNFRVRCLTVKSSDTSD